MLSIEDIGFEIRLIDLMLLFLLQMFGWSLCEFVGIVLIAMGQSKCKLSISGILKALATLSSQIIVL